MIDVVVGAPLVLAANRDEFFARPTRSPEVLRESPRVVGGRDVLSGGTWLALRANARFAAVTNQRVMATPPPGLISRGHAVIDTVAAEDGDAYVAALDATKYASMNLVWGDANSVSVAYARREEGTVEIVPLGRGVHVLCNDRIGAEGFPRGERLAAALTSLIGQSREEVLRALPALLADHTMVEPGPSHFPPDIARALTAGCIHSEAYGTRSSTILALAPREVLAYLHADGPPCTTPFRDLRALL